jgi:hypothetical protein
MRTATVTTAPWLGKCRDRDNREQFPEATLNEAQIRVLFSMENQGRAIVELDLKPALLKLTDEIIEIHTRFGHPRSRFTAEPTYLWLDISGNVLSALVEKYEGPQGVHPPGAKFRKWAIGYLRTPDMHPYDKAEEVEYEHMYCISDKGGVDQVRKHIREHWVA